MSRLSRPGMCGGRRIKQILPAGNYAFSPQPFRKFVRVTARKLQVSEVRNVSGRGPRRVRIPDVSWQEHRERNWSAHLESGDETLVIPVEKADRSSLGYYGCRILRRGDVISVAHRSVVIDFFYQHNYLADYVMKVLGGPRIEQHDFGHVDTPLGTASGRLLIGKVDSEDRALELTAFVVEAMHSVYIPAGTIHTNDFLLGPWETLLSSDCEFPSANLCRRDGRPLRVVFQTR